MNKCVITDLAVTRSNPNNKLEKMRDHTSTISSTSTIILFSNSIGKKILRPIIIVELDVIKIPHQIDSVSYMINNLTRDLNSIPKRINFKSTSLERPT